MRTWTRTEFPRLCGGCPTVIKRGDPVQVLTLPGVSRLKYRCPACAGEPPPDLPAYVERAPIVPRMLPLKAVAATVDFKSRQVGEDDGGAA